MVYHLGITVLPRPLLLRQSHCQPEGVPPLLWVREIDRGEVGIGIWINAYGKKGFYQNRIELFYQRTCMFFPLFVLCK